MTRNRPLLLPALLLALVLVALPTEAWASTAAPEGLGFINGAIAYVKRAAVPTIVLLIMFAALGWVVVKNSDGIVQWGGRAVLGLAIILGAATFLTAFGFSGATI